MNLKNVKMIPLINSYQVAKELSEGNIDYGVMAINNSIGGIVKETYKYKPYENLTNCNLPKLFVHGDKDSALPYKLSESVSEQCSNFIFKLIKNGDHTFMNSNDTINEAIEVTVDFVKNVFKGVDLSV